MNKIEADLHIHSIYSDGTFFPNKILDLAMEKGLKIISITDHDCIGYDLDKPNIIPGIEISAEQEIEDKTVKGLEILGYGFNINKMKEKIEPFRKAKFHEILECINNFNRFDFKSNLFTLKSKKEINIKDFLEFRCNKKLTEDELDNLITKSAPTKIDFAEFLYNMFFNSTSNLQKTYHNLPLLFKNEFLDTIFNISKNKKPTFKDAIYMIKKCGGISILAHPGACEILSKNSLKEKFCGVGPLSFIKFLKEEYGLHGVELYNYSGVMKYSKFAMDSINNYFKILSKKLNLLNTWGSDCHGDKWWGMQIGSFGSTIEDINKFLKFWDWKVKCA